MPLTEEQLKQDVKDAASAVKDKSLSFLQLRWRFLLEHKLDGSMMIAAGFASGYLYRLLTSL